MITLLRSKTIMVISLLAMLTMNFLANFLPLNNITTGEISDAYPNLFAPAGFTFAIWGVIYLLLILYASYALKHTSDFIPRINGSFSLSSFANALWIIAWHYQIMWLSLLLMLIILGCLIDIALKIKQTTLTPSEKFFVKIPFDVYFGWITVATIANVTVLLVAYDFSGFGISEGLWTSAVLLVGLLIGIATSLKIKGYAYNAVLIWAYWGILSKHLSETGFNKTHTEVIIIASICLVIFCLNFIALYKKPIA